MAKSYPWFEEVYAFPIRELRKNKRYVLDILRLLIKLRRTKYDQIMNLYRITSWTGALKMGILFALLKARDKIGHDRYGFGLFLTQKVFAGIFEGRHMADAMQEIALTAGGIRDDRGLEVFWNPKSIARWDTWFKGLSGQILVGINPGGDRENRRWFPDRFAAVARGLIERFGARIILLGGPAEKRLAAFIADGIHADVINLCGEIPLDELPYVLSRLDILITNDSGPMHIAAADGTPIVALFGLGDPEHFRPYMAPERYRILHKPIPCRPCEKDQCASPLCLEAIFVEEVLASCMELLNGKKR